MIVDVNVGFISSRHIAASDISERPIASDRFAPDPGLALDLVSVDRPLPV